ncbi:hypothetical protein HY500_03220 [Candidatus Woesearchaeota archaeon]|nr:hypothetical protein [Candidatus Woesearchaeota archaeon]
MAELIILPAVILGAIIGLYELILIHKDENFQGSHWLTHGLHAAIWAIIATFAVMNVEFVYENLIFLQTVKYLDNQWIFRGAIGLITLIKIHSASAVVKTTVGSSKGLKETWAHSLIVVLLIYFSPEIWSLIEPLVSSYL